MAPERFSGCQKKVALQTSTQKTVFTKVSQRKKIPPAEAAREHTLIYSHFTHTYLLTLVFKDDAVTLAVGGHHFGVLSDQSGVSGKTGVSDRPVRHMVKHLTKESLLAATVTNWVCVPTSPVGLNGPPG